MRTRGELLVERIVWNAAAGAALAVMVLLLLWSLQWLDRISPGAVRVDPPAVTAGPRVGTLGSPEAGATGTAPPPD
ncbi:MAG TPA: hypothetical protein ENI85_02775 [Deltaproteobacteria bacterium]|nr:hypothetical protein [Deltaproteobacteria bacterium]